MLLKIENLHKNFGDLHVLKGVTFSVEKGEVIVILGRSGCGKSTLLRCINGLEAIQEGNILFQGQKVDTQNRRSIRAIREKIGFVFQSYNLFPHYNALDNTTIALRVTKKMSKAESEEIGKKALNQVGLGDKLDSYPAELSGGQQQRIAIARAIAMGPTLMLFDEVTSALDPELIGEVLNTMETLAQSGMSMIVVTHEMGFAKAVATKIMFMDQGKILEQDDPQKFFE